MESIVRVLVAYGTEDIDQAVTAPRSASTTADPVLVIGIARYPSAKCWRFGVAWRGVPLTWISAHRRKQAAEQQILHVCQAALSADLTDGRSFATLVQELADRGDQALWLECEAAGQRVLEQVRSNAQASDRQRRTV